jgi:hypothetical protein
MKLDDIVLNRDNPRKYDNLQLDKCIRSLINFPEMLSVRDIILNSNNIVLCGNMRVTALKKISSLNSLEIGNYIDAGRDKKALLDYWGGWKNDLNVDVTISQLDDDEEKELIFKDNREFGQYDFEKLSNLYSEDDLISFGFNEDLFYKIEEDDTRVPSDSAGSKPIVVNTAWFGNYKIETIKEEYYRIKEVFCQYVKDNTVSYGFINYLLNDYGKNINSQDNTCGV